MKLVDGLNHVAILTADLDRFVGFYTSIFEMQVVFEEETPAFRHAILKAGEGAWIHPAEVQGNVHADALPEMFARGHIDHLALRAPTRDAFTEIRARLMAADATTGTVEDLGAMHSLWFRDPDGMRGEVCLVVDAALRSFHAPEPLAATP
jgi:catechol 2,3-dioxygenase-like lactoylglutathione lyase family enzyme